MLLEVRELCRRVATDLGGLITELQVETGRLGHAEEEAWKSSLDKACQVLCSPKLGRFHVHLGQRGRIAVEYRLPASASYCDVVLLGRGEQRPAAVIVELKDWHPGAAQRSRSPDLIVFHGGELILHPVEQVRGYVDYCRRFHSAVIDSIADVHGCVFFTRMPDTGDLGDTPRDRLPATIPMFADRQVDTGQRFPDFVLSHLSAPDEAFATAFERGTYRQDRNFCNSVGELIRSGQSPFVLLDHQRLALAVCIQAIDEALRSQRKTVIVIEGPAGSGKSAVAAHLWAALRARPEFAKDACVITTTSAAQRTNWKHLFERTRPGAGGIVLPAAAYSPADTRWVGDYCKAHGKEAMAPSHWRENIETCRTARGRLGPDTPPLVSIVDEAHALINPEDPRARTPAGFPVAFGPQAWHIIRASRGAVFLMDHDQGFRLRENTSAEDLRTWSREQGADFVGPISLAGAQFRAAGSVEYASWVDHLLDLGPVPPRKWSRKDRPGMGFEVVGDPFAMDERLREQLRKGHSARLVAAYGRPWLTRPNREEDAAGTPRPEHDFLIGVDREGRRDVWKRAWNYIPGGSEYSFFIQARAGSPMAGDSLVEVGCPYVVRGFDFDWIGLLWLNDLVWRDNGWRVLPENVYETGISAAVKGARREVARGAPGKDYAEVLRRTQQAYRILLTRAIKGVVVWFEDPATRDHVLGTLEQPESA
jgi:hypothetical protein